ncbi:GntR family transcriptional regulator [Blastopirellula marina]|uniref:HTH gntR-type domain-containing protein n=1 Tax=Blastopirellula marina TaxID=124 RepID=A0A2S8FDA2_9BACT|nr:LacI family DNA-binding transcriptional regulator [Blastopirellula marina]PQO30129.1 hypothetical protein C5Y98_21505 [Blastopirellula marina]PQO43181.1 hypothetical protein C5Y93_26120 [Blastopirellula marina]PTL42567.1 hypothetical protein C5Y97_21515 [Blastopirellula marina]
MTRLNLDVRNHLADSSEFSGQPKYEQLREHVVSQIKSGTLKAGAALPSESRLAEHLQIARSTVRQALAALERDGLILRVHGKGTFIHEEARQRLQKSQDLYALILPEMEAGFYPALQRSFEQAAGEMRNQVVVCNSNNEVEKQASAILQLIDLRVAGVAIVPATSGATPTFQIRQLQRNGIPVVCCSRPIPGTQTPVLAIPFENIGKLAGQKIGAAGHTRAAFFSTGKGTATDAYERGFREAMGARADVDVFISSGNPTDYKTIEKDCGEAIDQLFQRPHPPTAFFCGFDSYAEMIYLMLAQRGLRVPTDVSLVGFGGTQRGGGLARHLTSVVIDEVGMGAQAVAMLASMRKGETPIDAHEVRQLPLSFNLGTTLYAPEAE